METITDHTAKRATSLLWVHAGLFGVIALACYLWPETAFGDAAWLPLSRLSALLFAAALVAVIILLIGSIRAGTVGAISLALLAALALDVQIPVLMFSQPASLEHMNTDVGVPWFVLPLISFVLVGLTVHCLLRIKRERRGATAG